MCHNAQQIHHTSTWFLRWSWLALPASKHSQDKCPPGFLSLSPPGNPKRGRKEAPPCLSSVVKAMLRKCWKPGLFPGQQQSSVDVLVCWELPRGLQPTLLCSVLSFPSGVFINHHFFSVAVCQLLTRAQKEPSSSFVIYGPARRPDLLCLCPASPEDFKSVTHSGEGTRARELPSNPSQVAPNA